MISGSGDALLWHVYLLRNSGNVPTNRFFFNLKMYLLNFLYVYINNTFIENLDKTRQHRADGKVWNI